MPGPLRRTAEFSGCFSGTKRKVPTSAGVRGKSVVAGAAVGAPRAGEVRVGPGNNVRCSRSRATPLAIVGAAADDESGRVETRAASRPIFPMIVFMGQNVEISRRANGSDYRA